MTNSADPDHMASSTDLDLHCLLRQGMSCSAREGLNWQAFLECFYKLFVTILEMSSKYV